MSKLHSNTCTYISDENVKSEINIDTELNPEEWSQQCILQKEKLKLDDKLQKLKNQNTKIITLWRNYEEKMRELLMFFADIKHERGHLRFVIRSPSNYIWSRSSWVYTNTFFKENNYPGDKYHNFSVWQDGHVIVQFPTVNWFGLHYTVPHIKSRWLGSVDSWYLSFNRKVKVSGYGLTFPALVVTNNVVEIAPAINVNNGEFKVGSWTQSVSQRIEDYVRQLNVLNIKLKQAFYSLSAKVEDYYLYLKKSKQNLTLQHNINVSDDFGMTDDFFTQYTKDSQNIKKLKLFQCDKFMIKWEICGKNS